MTVDPSREKCLSDYRKKLVNAWLKDLRNQLKDLQNQYDKSENKIDYIYQRYTVKYIFLGLLDQLL